LTECSDLSSGTLTSFCTRCCTDAHGCHDGSNNKNVDSPIHTTCSGTTPRGGLQSSQSGRCSATKTDFVRCLPLWTADPNGPAVGNTHALKCQKSLAAAHLLQHTTGVKAKAPKINRKGDSPNRGGESRELPLQTTRPH